MKRGFGYYIFKRWLIIPALAVITFILTRIAVASPGWVERIYSENIYPVIASVLSPVSDLIPFSLDDIFYLALIFSTLFLVVWLILKKITFLKAGKITLNVLAVVYCLFYWNWGFNYFRSDLNRRLLIPQTSVNEKDFSSVLKELILKTNQSYTTFNDFSKSKIDSLVEDSYREMAPFLKIKYPMGRRRAKSITFGRFFASAGISGYYGPFFNEVHLDRFVLPVEYPVILAHEKAHQFGITSEAEANFYAWLVCSQSPSRQLQYSANLYVLQYFLAQAYKLENFKELADLINPEVKADIRRIENHWRELRNVKIDHAAGKVNDAYLKSNNIKKGIEDYTGVVRLVMDYLSDGDALQRVRSLSRK